MASDGLFTLLRQLRRASRLENHTPLSLRQTKLVVAEDFIGRPGIANRKSVDPGEDLPDSIHVRAPLCGRNDTFGYRSLLNRFAQYCSQRLASYPGKLSRQMRSFKVNGQGYGHTQLR